MNTTPASHLRIAQVAGAIYLDLADPAGQVVQITGAGWRVCALCSAREAAYRAATLEIGDPRRHDGLHFKFIRPSGMLALPTPLPARESRAEEPATPRTADQPGDERKSHTAKCPSRGAQIPNSISQIAFNLLRPLVNLPDDNAWILFVAWLVAALRPGLPCPILILTGEQGTAKTTLARMARALIDPEEVPLRAPPRSERDLAAAAQAGWFVAFDNVSALPATMADGLARLVSGGGFPSGQRDGAGREKLFQARRPVIINGIDDLTSRADVLDRSILLRLPPIPDARRLGEEELWSGFEAVRPRVLGTLLDAVAMGLANTAHMKLARRPRMADFAAWVAAAEPALPWARGAFMAAYLDNRRGVFVNALEASPLAKGIIELMDHLKGQSLSVTAARLNEELTRWASKETRRLIQMGAISPRKMGSEVRRLAPGLRAMGIDVSFGGHTREGNLIILTPIPGEAQAQPPAPRPPESAPESALEWAPDRPRESKAVAAVGDASATDGSALAAVCMRTASPVAAPTAEVVGEPTPAGRDA